MSGRTKIEWTEAAWDPVTGCTPVKDFRVSFWPERLDEPLGWRKPRMVFVCSMGDLFHEDVPFDFIDRVFAIMALCPQHTFQVLTKRADRMRAYITAEDRDCPSSGMEIFSAWTTEQCVREWVDSSAPMNTEPQRHNRLAAMDAAWPLPNVWLGVSVENQKAAAADERIPHLLNTPAAARFVSAEPLLGELDLSYDGLGLTCPTCGGTGEITDPQHPMHPSQTGEPPEQNWCMDCNSGDPRLVLGLDWVIADGEQAGVPFGRKKAGRLLGGREHNDLPEQTRNG